MRRPNILFVFADQLRYDSLACNGNLVVQTPNIDRLAREGVSFDRAYSSCPICSPYRGQLLTGNYSHVNGVVCNEYRLFDGQRTLAHRLGDQGYRTAYVGKWHLGHGPYPEHKRYGFDDLIAYNCIHSYYRVRYWHNESGPWPMIEYAPRAETDLALNYLRTHGGGEQPVFLVLGWGPPHWNALNKERRYGDYPQEYDLYDPGQIELSDNVPRQFREFARREIADYYGMVTSLDDCMGRILDELEQCGLADNTIVCFSSDHGDHLSSHGFGTPADAWMHHSLRGSKATPYEESCHVPLVIRDPGAQPSRKRNDAFLSSVDIAPTLMDLCRVGDFDDMQGQSLAGALRGQPFDEPDSVYLQVLGPGWPIREQWLGLWRGVRTKRWMYARWHDQGARRLLFDVQGDPAEMRNLAADVDHSADVAQCETLLQDWIKSTGDPFDTGKRLPVTGMLDLGQAFITSEWNSRAPRDYARAIEGNDSRFKSGEQPGDTRPHLAG
jgi:arylsulfatase A-like enzyme